MVADHERVAYRWTMAGTDSRTGEQRSWAGTSMSRLVDGKIAEEWYYSKQSEADINEIVEWLESQGWQPGGGERG